MEIAVLEPAERYITVTDVAKYLNVKKSMVYVAVEEHGLPVARIGRHFRFKLSQVEAWAAGDRAKPALAATPPPAHPHRPAARK
jgi:excisionase family DNA binding protein